MSKAQPSAARCRCGFNGQLEISLIEDSKYRWDYLGVEQPKFDHQEHQEEAHSKS
jgi:hypothetical protein